MKIAQPIRVALTGKTVSPPIDEVMEALGKEEVIQRLEGHRIYERPIQMTVNPKLSECDPVQMHDRT